MSHDLGLHPHNWSVFLCVSGCANPSHLCFSLTAMPSTHRANTSVHYLCRRSFKVIITVPGWKYFKITLNISYLTLKAEIFCLRTSMVAVSDDSNFTAAHNFKLRF